MRVCISMLGEVKQILIFSKEKSFIEMQAYEFSLWIYKFFLKNHTEISRKLNQMWRNEQLFKLKCSSLIKCSSFFMFSWEGHFIIYFNSKHHINEREQQYCRIALKQNPQSKLHMYWDLLFSESYILSVVTMFSVVHPRKLQSIIKMSYFLLKKMIHCSTNENQIVLLYLILFYFHQHIWWFLFAKCNITKHTSLFIFIFLSENHINITSLTEFLGHKGHREREVNCAFIPCPSNIFLLLGEK